MTEYDGLLFICFVFFLLGLLLYLWIIKVLASLARFLDAKTKSLEKND